VELLEKLRGIDPYYFEKVILILLKKMGYGDFIETSKSGDGGIDGIINEDKLGLEKIYTQAKRYNENKVREKDIRNFIGAMSGDTRKGVFITTSSFDAAAIKKAHDAHHTIILIDGSKLVDLMHQFNVGIQIKTVYEIKELDNDFFEGE
jgi:restriction system protein